VELSHIDDLGPKSARQERKVHRLLALIVGKGDRFLGGGLCRGVVHRGPTFKKLRAGRSRLRRRGKFWRSHPKLVRLLRLKIPYLAASARRPRVSSRPNAAMISKSPGDCAWPVRAARRGWATSPILRSLRST